MGAFPDSTDEKIDLLRIGVETTLNVTKTINANDDVYAEVALAA